MSLVVLSFVVIQAIVQYRAIAKVVDNDRTLSDPRTLEFSASQLMVTGPDWKAEVPWTRFRACSGILIIFICIFQTPGLRWSFPGAHFPQSSSSAFVSMHRHETPDKAQQATLFKPFPY